MKPLAALLLLCATATACLTQPSYLPPWAKPKFRLGWSTICR